MIWVDGMSKAVFLGIEGIWNCLAMIDIDISINSNLMLVKNIMFVKYCSLSTSKLALPNASYSSWHLTHNTPTLT